MKHTHLIMATLLFSSQLMMPVISLAEEVAPIKATTEKLEQEDTPETSETSETSESNQMSDSLPLTSTEAETEDSTDQTLNETDKLNSSNVENKSAVPLDTLDTTITPEVSVENHSPSSTANPLTPGDSIVYKLTLTNRDTEGKIVPAGTKIKFTITPVAGVSASNLLTYLSYSTENMKAFTVESTTDGVILTLANDLYPGTQEVNVNFLVKNPGYNWDGLDNKTDPAVAFATVESSLVEVDGTTTTINSDQIYVKPSKYSPPVNPGTAGWTASGTGGISGLNNSNYPDDQASVKSDSVYLQNPYNRSISGSMFFSYFGNFQPVLSANPQTGGLYFKSDLPFDPSANTLYYNGVDISNAPGVVWHVSEDKLTVEVVFSDYMQANGIVNGNFYARVYVPVTDINSVNVVYTACRSYGNNGSIATQGAWTYTTMFQSVANGTSVPYFRGTDKTIYTTDNYDPLQDVYAYSAQTNITNAIKITNYDGYPVDGKQPAAGSYTIHYNVTNATGETSEFTRKITVLANQQTITGSDYTMYVGDKTPTVADFKASAKDKDGNPSTVTVDLLQAEEGTPGDYPVKLTSEDGQTKEVILHVLANQQVINGSDYTMYVGDPTPIVADFKASAKDRAGNPSEVVVDLSQAEEGTPGDYPVKLTSEDGQTKEVMLHVLVNQQVINGSDYTMYVGDPTPTAADFKASAKDKAGNPSEVVVDLSQADEKKPGDYPVKLSSKEGQTKQVTLHVVTKAGITASDKTKYVGDKLTKETILSWATFTNSEEFSTGFTVEGAGIPVSSTDTLIQAGTYRITYYIANDEKVHLVEKTIILTVLDKIGGNDNSPTATTAITSGSSTADPGTRNKTNLPSTGERNNPFLYMLGTVLLAAVGIFSIRTKSSRKKQ